MPAVTRIAHWRVGGHSGERPTPRKYGACNQIQTTSAERARPPGDPLVAANQPIDAANVT